MDIWSLFSSEDWLALGLLCAMLLVGTAVLLERYWCGCHGGYMLLAMLDRYWCAALRLRVA